MKRDEMAHSASADGHRANAGYTLRALTVAEALTFESLVRAGARVVAGAAHLDNEIRWAHSGDVPDIARWLRGGELLLTTGLSWPSNTSDRVELVRAFHGARLAAVLLSAGPYVRRVPEEMIALADALGLPMIEMPWGTPLISVTEAVHAAIINRQYALLRRSEEIHTALTRVALRGRSLEETATQLARLIGRSVLIEDIHFTLLARGRPPDARDVGWSRVDPSHQARLRAHLRHIAEPMRLSGAFFGQAHDRVVCPIRTGQTVHGYLSLIDVEEQATLDALDLLAAQHGATVAALQIMWYREVTQAEERLSTNFVDVLIREQFEGPEDLRVRALVVGCDTSVDYVVVIVALAGLARQICRGDVTEAQLGDRKDYLVVALRRFMTQQGCRLLYTRAADRLIVLFPTIGPDKKIDRALLATLHDALTQALGDVALRLSVGGVHRGLSGIPCSYTEARRALAVRADAAPPGVIYYDDLAVFALLQSVPRDGSLERLVDGTLGTLLDKGGPRAVLLATLEALDACGYDRQEVCQRLGIHLNTLKQRVARVEKISGLDLGATSDRLRIALACEARRALAQRSDTIEEKSHYTGWPASRRRVVKPLRRPAIGIDIYPDDSIVSSL